MNKRWTVGLVGLGLATAVAVPAAGRSHYTGRVPANVAAEIAAADPLPTPARVVAFGHKKAAAVTPAHKKKSTAKHVTRHKHKARSHKAKAAK